MPGNTTPMPVGTVISYVGNLGTIESLAREGWLLCDGRSLPNAQYPDLFDAIGTAFGGTGFPDFNLPDLRGMFLRGADLNAGIDPDIGDRTAQGVDGNTGKTTDTVGSRQADQLNNHQHQWDQNYGLITRDGSNLTVQLASNSPTPENQGTQPTTLTDGGGNETRPKNVYVYYLILAGEPAAMPTA